MQTFKSHPHLRFKFEFNQHFFASIQVAPLDSSSCFTFLYLSIHVRTCFLIADTIPIPFPFFPFLFGTTIFSFRTKIKLLYVNKPKPMACELNIVFLCVAQNGVTHCFTTGKISWFLKFVSMTIYLPVVDIFVFPLRLSLFLFRFYLIFL